MPETNNSTLYSPTKIQYFGKYVNLTCEKPRTVQVSGVISWGLQKHEGHFISAAFSNISQLPQPQSPPLKTTEEENKYYEDSSEKI